MGPLSVPTRAYFGRRLEILTPGGAAGQGCPGRGRTPRPRPGVPRGRQAPASVVQDCLAVAVERDVGVVDLQGERGERGEHQAAAVCRPLVLRERPTTL